MNMADVDIKVSIILPSLNVKDYIEEALDSVIMQSLKDIEIICVDAGSDDGTEDIIERYAKKDKRIRFIRSTVRSYGYQVNLGIEESHGKYIAVLETDDKVASEMYERLYRLAEDSNADYVKADYNAFFTQIDGSYYYFERHNFTDKSLYDVVLEPIKHQVIARDDWYLWQGIYRREYLNNYGIRFSETPGAAYQDIGILYLTGIYAKRAVYIREPLYGYRIDRELASSNSGKGLLYSYAEFDRLIELGKNFSILRSEEVGSIISEISNINLKEYLNSNNEFTIDSMINIYESMGANCIKK